MATSITDNSISSTTLSIDAIQGATAAGTVDLPAGHLNNFNMTRHTAKNTITSTNFTTVYSCNITPKFATSLILVTISISATHRNHHSGLVRCYRSISGGTQNTVWGGGLDSQDVGAQWSNIWFNVRKEHSDLTYYYSTHTYSASYLDTPNTTSQITYDVKVMTTGDSEGIFINRTGQNTQSYDSSCGSTIMVQEVLQ